MALIHCDFFSDALGLSTSMTVILPQETSAQIGLSGRIRTGGHPVLYLLHGLSDDHTIWSRRTSIERYVAPLGLAVVMPQVHRSFYTDEHIGNRYWTFVSEELPRVMRSFFRLSGPPEDTFVAGLSMGGYGAFKLALTHPDRYAAAASLSGALDVAELAGRPERSELFERAFGGAPGPADDLAALLAAADAGSLPPLYVSCGTEDELLPMNRRFAAEAEAAGARVTADFRPGEHEWGLWDAVIREVIDWLPLRRS
jgi:putative tributyrin esterase